MVCLPLVVEKKMSAIPVEPDLYGMEVDDALWEPLRHWLCRERKAGNAGDYVRVPVGPGKYLVVSDAEIGHYIDRAIVEDYMLKAATEWGSITRSRGWEPVKTVTPEGFQDEGICTARLVHITNQLEQMDLGDPRINDHTFSYRTTMEQHLHLKRLSGVMTDADFWSERRSAAEDDVMFAAKSIISRIRAERDAA